MMLLMMMMLVMTMLMFCFVWLVYAKNRRPTNRLHEKSKTAESVDNFFLFFVFHDGGTRHCSNASTMALMQQDSHDEHHHQHRHVDDDYDDDDDDDDDDDARHQKMSWRNAYSIKSSKTNTSSGSVSLYNHSLVYLHNASVETAWSLNDAFRVATWPGF